MKPLKAHINSLRPSDAYMRQYNIPALLQIMACRLFGAKPLSEPMLPYCQLDPKEHILVKFYSKLKIFLFTKIHLKMSPGKWQTCCLGLNVLTGEQLLGCSVCTLKKHNHIRTGPGLHFQLFCAGFQNFCSRFIEVCTIEWLIINYHDFRTVWDIDQLSFETFDYSDQTCASVRSLTVIQYFSVCCPSYFSIIMLQIGHKIGFLNHSVMFTRELMI